MAEEATRLRPAGADVDDPCTQSNHRAVRVTHSKLVWNVMFDCRQIKGSAELTAEVIAEGSTELVLDTNKLVISSVRVRVGGGKSSPARWTLGEADAVMGQALRVPLASGASLPRGSVVQVTVAYATKAPAGPHNVNGSSSPGAGAPAAGSASSASGEDNESSGLQWLSPEQTDGRKHPYLFTQCQAIYARTLLPCQDTPAVKSTYEAKVTVNEPLVAVMSAERVGVTEAFMSVRQFLFRQRVPVPSYLIALAVGHLESRRVGPRSEVWAEPGVVEKVAHEFADTERFLTTAEELVGKYEWGIYDILCLPASFPYGGMENPCMTFVTPTLLAGDRSLASVVIHEISHSWTGNLTTNANWEHFWLNEGGTMFLQRKIMERLYGRGVAQTDMVGGHLSLKDAVEHYGCRHPLTALVPDLAGVHPDDAFSRVPYEKGFNFLYYLQTQVIGDESAFEAFFKHYIQRFAGTSITSDDFRACFTEYFCETHPTASSAVDWDGWFRSPGMPLVPNVFDGSARSECEALADSWLAGHPLGKPSTLDSRAAVVFLDRLLVRSQDMAAASVPTFIAAAVLNAMDAEYAFTASGNSEIKYRWLKLCLRSGAAMNRVLPAVAAFLRAQGRMKFTRPLYRALMASSAQGRDLAHATFRSHRAFYHPICARKVASDLDAATRVPLSDLGAAAPAPSEDELRTRLAQAKKEALAHQLNGTSSGSAAASSNASVAPVASGAAGGGHGHGGGGTGAFDKGAVKPAVVATASSGRTHGSTRGLIGSGGSLARSTVAAEDSRKLDGDSDAVAESRGAAAAAAPVAREGGPASAVASDEAESGSGLWWVVGGVAVAAVVAIAIIARRRR